MYAVACVRMQNVCDCVCVQMECVRDCECQNVVCCSVLQCVAVCCIVQLCVCMSEWRVYAIFCG